MTGEIKTFENFETDVVTEYIVGIPSGEVIDVSPNDLVKLKNERLIKYNQKTKYFTFYDANYKNVKKLLIDPMQIQYIHRFMDILGISKYKINSDYTIDVNGSVNISQKRLNKIPVKFAVINGNFDCGYNNLSNLVNAPDKVNGYFDCTSNKIYTLINGPTYVGGGYYCCDNYLEDLKGYPDHCQVCFDCSINHIKTLKGTPRVIDSQIFNISHNRLTTLSDGPIKTKNFNCSYNNIHTLSNGIKEVEGNFNCSYNKLTSLTGMPSCNKIVYIDGNEIDELEYD